MYRRRSSRTLAPKRIDIFLNIFQKVCHAIVCSSPAVLVLLLANSINIEDDLLLIDTCNTVN